MTSRVILKQNPPPPEKKKTDKPQCTVLKDVFLCKKL